MRRRKDTPAKGNTITFRAGAPGSEGIKLEFTRNFDRSKLPPEQISRDMNGAVVSALRKSLVSTDSFESVNAAEMILKNPELKNLDDIKLDAVNIIVEFAVKNKEWFRIRPLLDHKDPEIKEHTNKKLDWIEENNGREPI